MVGGIPKARPLLALLPEETVPVNETQLDAIAAQLRAARAVGRPVSPLSNSLPAFDVTAGYGVQESLRRHAGELAGWKLGLTSPAKQVQMSVAEPIRGYLAACDELLEGEALVVADYIQPRVEPEIVFVMGDDLAGARVSKNDVLAATAAFAVGIEVLDSRYIDYRFSLPDVVADNGSAARFVVGPHVPPQGIALRLVGVVLELAARTQTACMTPASSRFQPFLPPLSWPLSCSLRSSSRRRNARIHIPITVRGRVGRGHSLRVIGMRRCSSSMRPATRRATSSWAASSYSSVERQRGVVTLLAPRSSGRCQYYRPPRSIGQVRPLRSRFAARMGRTPAPHTPPRADQSRPAGSSHLGVTARPMSANLRSFASIGQ